jgi:hypothetical protein
MYDSMKTRKEFTMHKQKNKSCITINNIKLLLFIFLSLFTILSFVQADGGYISFSNILVFEPSQSAVIGWDGTTEVLLLSTNVKTNNQDMNWVIELIPFPSMPEEPVAGTIESIQAVTEIIDSRIGDPQSGDVDRSGGIDILDALMTAMYYVGLQPGGFYKITADVNGDQSIDIIDALMMAQYYVSLLNSPPQGRLDDVNVVFMDEIGVHNIIVVETENAGQLITFAEQNLAEVSPTSEVSWEEFQPVVADYIDRGMKYWVIDLLDLNSAEKSRDPLVYTFKTDFFYFPLIVSSVNKGDSLIEVFSITKKGLHDQDIVDAGFETMPINTYFEIISPDLPDINPGLYDMFAHFSSPLRIARHYYEGPLENLTRDIIAREKE